MTMACSPIARALVMPKTRGSRRVLRWLVREHATRERKASEKRHKRRVRDCHKKGRKSETVIP